MGSQQHCIFAQDTHLKKKKSYLRSRYSNDCKSFLRERILREEDELQLHLVFLLFMEIFYFKTFLIFIFWLCQVTCGNLRSQMEILTTSLLLFLQDLFCRRNEIIMLQLYLQCFVLSPPGFSFCFVGKGYNVIFQLIFCSKECSALMLVRSRFLSLFFF